MLRVANVHFSDFMRKKTALTLHAPPPHNSEERHHKEDEKVNKEHSETLQ
jgi:hypothetical protein